MTDRKRNPWAVFLPGSRVDTAAAVGPVSRQVIEQDTGGIQPALFSRAWFEEGRRLREWAKAEKLREPHPDEPDTGGVGLR